MRNEVYWIEGPWSGRLAIIARPRGGDWLVDEVESWRQTGFDAILSLLTPSEIEELELTQEAALCQNASIRFFSFPIDDRNVPSSQKMMLGFTSNLVSLLLEGQSIGIHCRQGIGRSALLVSCLLVVMGVLPEVALQRTATARGCAVPDTEEQRRWIFDFARYAAMPCTAMLHGQGAAK